MAGRSSASGDPGINPVDPVAVHRMAGLVTIQRGAVVGVEGQGVKRE